MSVSWCPSTKPRHNPTPHVCLTSSLIRDCSLPWGGGEVFGEQDELVVSGAEEQVRDELDRRILLLPLQIILQELLEEHELEWLLWRESIESMVVKEPMFLRVL